MSNQSLVMDCNCIESEILQPINQIGALTFYSLFNNRIRDANVQLLCQHTFLDGESAGKYFDTDAVAGKIAFANIAMA